MASARTWLDNLSNAEPNAYENLINAAAALDISTLPDVAENDENDSAREEILSNPPETLSLTTLPQNPSVVRR